MMQRQLVIGTRGSPLALYQARRVQRLLCEAEGVGEDVFPIKIFTTAGDKIKGELAQFGGKGLFTKELEVALMTGDVDMAVHSMKDVPTLGQDSLLIAAVLDRADVRDAFISPRHARIQDLPEGALVGTASIRRRAQLLTMRPDIRFTLLRGNVGTRLEKLGRGDCEATFLACAGLKRLGQVDVITEAVPTSVMLPAPAQGAIGVEVRKDDQDAQDRLSVLDHDETHFAITVERAFLRALDGDCRTPIAALATYDGTTLAFKGEVLSKDGKLRFTRDKTLNCKSRADAFTLGYQLGESVKEEIGERILWDEK